MQEQSEPTVSPINSQPSEQQGPPVYTFWVALVLGVLSILAVLYGLYLYFQSRKPVVEAPQQIELEQIEQAERAPASPSLQLEKSNPEPTATASANAAWTSFISDQLGISFEYPSSYDKPVEQSGYLSILSPLDPPKDKSGMVQDTELKIEIIKEASPANDSPNQCWQDHTFGETTISSKSPIVVDGVTTENMVWEGMGTGQFICVIKNNFRYLINKYPAETTRQAEFDQFLQSFAIMDVSS